MFYRFTKQDSGIALLSEKISKVRSVALGFWFNVGAVDETEKQAGSSHFLEHSLFKGSKNYPSAKSLSNAFDEIGADVNAYTSKEYTFYYIKMLDEHLEKGFKIMADMIQQPLIKKSDIESERKVIAEEIMMTEDTPDDKIHDMYVENIWPGHPAGRPILGTMDSLNAISHKDVKQFFNDNYFHNNLAIAAAGNIEHARLEELAADSFKNINVGDHAHERTAPTFKSGLHLLNKQTEQAHIVMGFPSIDHAHPDRYILGVMNSILSGGMSSRLNQVIREKHGLTYAVYSFNHSFSAVGTWAIYAGTRPENLGKVYNLSLKELEKLKKKPVPLSELQKVKEQIKSGMVFSTESTSRRMERLGRPYIEGRKIMTVDEHLKLIDKVNADDIMKMAKQIFDLDNMSVSVIGPFAKPKLKKILSEN